MRWLLLFGGVFAFTVAAPLGFEAVAAKKGGWCSASTMDGKQTKWRCKAGQKCCYSLFSGKACIGASDICL
jgi:hypothetical protein